MLMGFLPRMGAQMCGHEEERTKYFLGETRSKQVRYVMVCRTIVWEREKRYRTTIFEPLR